MNLFFLSDQRPNLSFERIHNGGERSLASVSSAAPLRPAQLQR